MVEKFKLTKRDIVENFDDRTYSKGFNYYRQKRVKSYELYYDEGDEEAFARGKVEGSHTYKQHIEFSSFGDFVIEGDCSCPVGYNCKHVVAVLFEMLANEDSLKPESDTSKWMNQFMQLHKPKEKQLEIHEKEFFLIFRIFRDSENQFDFCKAKYLKNGSISKGTKISHDNMMYRYTSNYYYPFLTEEDRQLIGQLSNISDGRHYNTSYIFADEYGTLMLKKLVQTGKCYLRESTVPLRYVNEPKTLTFSWVKQGKNHRLQSNLYKGQELTPYTVPPLCINSEDNTLCEVKTEYDTEGLKCMFSAPVMSTEQMNKMTHQVIETIPELDFPLPKSFKVETFEVEAKPYLYLYGKREVSQTVHAMELHFMYEDYEIDVYPANDKEMVSENNKMVKVLRDSNKERECRELVESLGFEFENRLKSYMSFANPTMQAAIERWRDFMENRIEVLRAAGWEIEVDESFNFSFEYADEIVVESEEGGDTNPWFELSFSVEVGGRSVALMPIVTSLLQEYDSIEEIPEKLNLEMEEGKFLHIESKDIKPILKTIFELFDKKEGDSLIIKPYDAHLLELDEESDIVWKGTKELKELSAKLKNFKGITSVTPAKTLNAELRDYQQFGLDWLNFLHTFRFGGILADDMGLGKTVQTLAFLQLLKSKSLLTAPTLIIMPTSLIGNWKNEIEKFTEELSYLELYGIDRAEKFKEIGSHDIILTTYQLAQRDEEKYKKEKFFYIILDEAQKIKNPKTKMAVAIKSFSSEYKLALSGTPIENHLGELWSIFDFVMPGFLENLKLFKGLYQNPIEKENDMTRRSLLNKKVAPFILRRTKDEVALELPNKT